MAASKRVRKVQELRRSNASGAIPSKKVYNRKKTFVEQMATLRTEVDNTGVAKPGTTASGSKA